MFQGLVHFCIQSSLIAQLGQAMPATLFGDRFTECICKKAPRFIILSAGKSALSSDDALGMTNTCANRI
jgi:hypothetical protein